MLRQRCIRKNELAMKGDRPMRTYSSEETGVSHKSCTEIDACLIQIAPFAIVRREYRAGRVRVQAAKCLIVPPMLHCRVRTDTIQSCFYW
jgi:hypothetical protein